MIRPRQPVQKEHPENCGESRQEDRQLVRWWYERRPAQIRTSAHVHRIVDIMHEHLKTQAKQQTRNAAEEYEYRKNAPLYPESFIDLVKRKRRERVGLRVPRHPELGSG